MQLPIDATERARCLGDVAAILIDLGRKARLAAEAAESAAAESPTAQPAQERSNDE